MTLTANGTEVGTLTVHKRGDGTEPPAGLGNVSEWGVVELSVDTSEGDVSPMAEACISPSSGGEWCYGWHTTTVNGFEPRKRCYSNYYHRSKRHSSTAVMAGVTDKEWADAGDISNTAVIAGFAYTCSTYYGIA
ncbi:lactococcin 972 family bacteriocin [Streptomyces avicenniae]|uniref:lactococcin 972 family bacteriocin n=1 Tax=Streptomyces avicenniae TaxID=500153 RepID=UPI00069B57CA|nr:lactococcin 972 family bacteriocin [Streptomyces avicenniae]